MSVAIFELHAGIVGSGPEGADAIADAAVLSRLERGVGRLQDFGPIERPKTKAEALEAEISRLRAAIEEAMPFQMTIGAEILGKALGPNVRANLDPTA